ncbi:MAG: formylglycine-generating enzyme family protein [Gammaproteobacteria bacterium]|nr:formylglycine-generating enzyme family protein [Gammaproteobacteria bacterium]
MEGRLAERAGVGSGGTRRSAGCDLPVGNEPDPNRANYAESEVRTTSPVGCFPGNAFGLYDMIGNVWEWTRSAYAAYPYNPRDAERSRPPKEAGSCAVARSRHYRTPRYTSRRMNRPDYRDFKLGFRVVLRGPPRFVA